MNVSIEGPLIVVAKVVAVEATARAVERTRTTGL